MLFFLGILLYFRAQKQSIPVRGMLEFDGQLQHTIDSIKAIEFPKIIYPFNPNFISDQRGYFLDLSPQEIDRLHAYRKQVKWINSVREFKKVTGVDSNCLHTFSTFFNFPSRLKKSIKNQLKNHFHL